MKKTTLYTLVVLLTSAFFRRTCSMFLEETFSDENWESRWKTPTNYENMGKFTVSPGNSCNRHADKACARALKTTEDAKFYAVSRAFDKTVSSHNTSVLCIQYSVTFEQGVDCGGGYVKLGNFDSNTFSGDSPYSIMFGPDYCGGSKTLHTILHYNGSNVGNMKNSAINKDMKPHLYTLVLMSNDTYYVDIDMKRVQGGTLKGDWKLLKDEEIPDTSVEKPDSWVDDEFVDDLLDIKPNGYDQILEMIPNPNATIPDDWDVESDGVWEAPLLKNPEYKGPWSARKIKNPDYKGQWFPPMIDNPEFVDDNNIYNNLVGTLSSIGIDVWQVKSGTLFDNMLVTDDIKYAHDMAKMNWLPELEANENNEVQPDGQDTNEVSVAMM